MTWPVMLKALEFLIPLLHLTGAIAAGHAILFARTSQGAIAWAMTLFFAPYVALPLYLVFGRQKFHGYVEARRVGDERIDHIAQKIVARLSTFKAILPGPSARFAVLNALTLTPFTTGNTGRLLVDGPETFDAIFEAIDAAAAYLLVQFFIIRDDALGR